MLATYTTYVSSSIVIVIVLCSMLTRFADACYEARTHRLGRLLIHVCL
jgi:hypothetical protein